MKRITLADVRRSEVEAVDADTLAGAARIVSDVRSRGDLALREHGERLGDIEVDSPMVLDRTAMQSALHALPSADRALLERTADRIRRFAEAQRACFGELDVEVPGGRAGHTVSPVERAGCYAPGGRYPLPSSVLMTAVTARAAGVREVWVASPRLSPITLAAAAVAGADAVLAIGGAQAIAAMAFGTDSVATADVIVGPGNRWVTAAKQLVAGRVGIDMLAGPSELVVLADAGADPEVVAADLIAQAEHDPAARPILVTPSVALADSVDQALARQLETLPTAAVASASLGEHGRCVLVADLDEGIAAVDVLAPEHLELLVAEPAEVAQRVQHYGGLFVGEASAEVMGDYGVGPNHVLPTGGTARFSGGLSVLDFLRVRTWLQLRPGETAAMAEDAAALARLEGLEGHARSAMLRR